MSKLVEALSLSPKEIEAIKGKQTKSIARHVVLLGLSYEATGKIHGITKQAVYDALKRIYQQKYGERYASQINPEDDETP